METKKFKSRAWKRRIALVQGELFRCVAVEAAPDTWKRAADGAQLPPVMEIVRLMGYCESPALR